MSNVYSNKKLKYFSGILKEVQSQSTCHRLKVGSVAVKNNRILCTGWNGVASGNEHCCDLHKDKDPSDHDFMDYHRTFSTFNEIHSEISLISYAAKHGIALEDAHLFVSISPCVDCAKAIVGTGITKVFYETEYDRSGEGLKYLENNGIEVEHLSIG